MPIVNPQWLQNTRSQLDDETIVKNLIQERPQLQKVLEKANFTNPSKFDYTKLLNVWSGTNSVQQGTAQPQKGGPQTQDTQQALGISGKSFFGRAFDSIQSVPERFQRSFGSKGVREGRQETSKGFDLADLPGDLADVAGKSIPFATSAIAGTAGALLGGGIASVATGAAAGAAGAAGGENVRQLVGDMMGVEDKFGLGGSTFNLKETAKEGAIGAVGELGGMAIAKVASKLLAPFASQFSDDIARIATREGVNLPASALSDSKLVGLADATASKGFFGGSLQATVDKATSQITEKTNALVKSFSNVDDIASAGSTIAKGLDEYEELWRTSKNLAYQNAEEELSKKLVVSETNQLIPNTSKTVELLQDIIAREQSSGDVLGKGFSTPMFKEMHDNLAKGQSLKSILEASKDLNKLGKHGSKDSVATGDTAVFRKIAATLDEDVMNWLKEVNPDAFNALNKADQVYKEGIETLNSSLGRTIESWSTEPLKIVDKVFTKKSPEKAKKVLELVLKTEGGQEKVANIQASFMRKLLDESQGNMDDLVGKRFKNTLNAYGEDLLHTVLGKDATKLLNDYADLSGALAKSQSISSGSQSAFLLKIMSVITALFTGGAATAAKIVGGDAAMTKLLNSSVGKHWLTKGIVLPNFAKEVIKDTTKLGIQGIGNAVTQ